LDGAAHFPPDIPQIVFLMQRGRLATHLGEKSMRSLMKHASSYALAALTLGGVSRAAHAQAPAPGSELRQATFTMESAVLKETRRINVYVPPGYDAPGAKRFPVLYMPDGGMEEDFPHVALSVDSAIRAGEMRPAIVVGIENTERRRDMTGPTTVHADSAIARHVGGSAAFRAFIRRELMPEVKRRYRTTRETAVMGESLAGLFVTETLFLEPDLFDTYIALSPSLYWNKEELGKKAAARLRARPRLHATFYLSSAGDDIGPEAGRLADTIRANAPAGLRWQYHPRPDLRHATIYLGESPRALREALPPAVRLLGRPAR
jgi:predicted alpha/beta superfamily hydrolase